MPLTTPSGKKLPHWATSIWYQCQLCKKCFEFKDRFTEHKRQHYEEKGEIWIPPGMRKDYIKNKKDKTEDDDEGSVALSLNSEPEDPEEGYVHHVPDKDKKEVGKKGYRHGESFNEEEDKGVEADDEGEDDDDDDNMSLTLTITDDEDEGEGSKSKEMMEDDEGQDKDEAVMSMSMNEDQVHEDIEPAEDDRDEILISESSTLTKRFITKALQEEEEKEECIEEEENEDLIEEQEENEEPIEEENEELAEEENEELVEEENEELIVEEENMDVIDSEILEPDLPEPKSPLEETESPEEMEKEEHDNDNPKEAEAEESNNEPLVVSPSPPPSASPSPLSTPKKKKTKTRSVIVTRKILPKRVCSLPQLPKRKSEVPSSSVPSSSLYQHTINFGKRRAYRLTKKSSICSSSIASSNVPSSSRSLHKCPHCADKTFTSQRAFDRHMKQHIQDKPFPCTICKVRLKSKASLTNHLISNHSRIRNHEKS